MNLIHHIADHIMNLFLPQVISDLGECHIRDLVSLYLDRGETPRLSDAERQELVVLCIKMNWGCSTVQP